MLCSEVHKRGHLLGFYPSCEDSTATGRTHGVTAPVLLLSPFIFPWFAARVKDVYEAGLRPPHASPAFDNIHPFQN